MSQQRMDINARRKADVDFNYEEKLNQKIDQILEAEKELKARRQQLIEMKSELSHMPGVFDRTLTDTRIKEKIYRAKVKLHRLQQEYQDLIKQEARVRDEANRQESMF